MGQVVQLNNSRKDFIFYVRQLQKLCEKDLSLINSIIIDKLDSNVPLIQEIASYFVAIRYSFSLFFEYVVGWILDWK